MTKRQPRTGYMAQCMHLGSAKVGQNLNLIPYANEQAAQDHIEHHVAEKGCERGHQVRSFTA